MTLGSSRIWDGRLDESDSAKKEGCDNKICLQYVMQPTDIVALSSLHCYCNCFILFCVFCVGSREVVFVVLSPSLSDARFPFDWPRTLKAVEARGGGPPLEAFVEREGEKERKKERKEKERVRTSSNVHAISLHHRVFINDCPASIPLITERRY